MDRQGAQRVKPPANPAIVFAVPLCKFGQVIVRLAASHVVPHPDAAGLFNDLVRFHTSRLGDAVGGIGDVVALALRIIAPAMRRAAQRVPFDLRTVFHHIRRGVAAHVHPHVGAIGVQQDRTPAGLAAIEHHFLAKEPNRFRRRGHVLGYRDHEPTARESQGPKPIFCRGSHKTCLLSYSYSYSLGGCSQIR